MGINSIFADQSHLSQDYLSSLLRRAREKFSLPSAAVVVMNSDEILFQEIQGVRVIGEKGAVTWQDYYHMGSTAKSVMALLAGKLVESGKIEWDTKFFDLFPELRREANPAYLPVTLEDLFLCRAGIQPYTSGEEKFPDLDPKAADARLQFIRHLIKQPPYAKARKDGRGFEHLYSNASYTMAAAMLERVAGKRYEAQVNQALEKEMGFSVFHGWPNQISPDQPWGHADWAKEGLLSFGPDHPYRIPPLIAPAGDLSMKPLDYAKYTQLHLRGLRGEDNYLRASTYRYIHFGHQGFSLGFANGSRAGIEFSEFDGSAGTFYCRSLVVPESNLALTIMTNLGSMKAVDWITRKIAKRHYNWWWKFWM